ncbi:MAG: Stp1/IreP family PP2C-type Ser/Thr phosphatase [Peptostreptococcaceae bacterium]|nr:Stp1/IreP family PP2C-type Ser/Thr phosphatase [Peptostreptococcaceae bacterium]
MKKIAISNKGYKRENNQDYQLMDSHNRYFIIADGMGGHKGGEVASYTAVTTAHRLLKNYNAKSLPQIEAKLIEVFNAANEAVYNMSFSKESLVGMGTTMIVSYLFEKNIVIAHVGDSRAYLFSGEDFIRLTKDQSLVQEMIDRGELNQIQAAVHPKRHMITKAIGTQSSIKPDVLTRELLPKAVSELFMCTDGLTDYVSDDEMKNICNHSDILEDSVNDMLELALKRGGYDNISISAIRLSESWGVVSV